jgi:stage II sporulation protein R
MDNKVKISCISFLIIGIIVLSGIGLWSYQVQPKKEYLRIHIRANSNLQTDQSIKYQIKDEIVKFLTPYIAECKTKSQATDMLNGKLKEIQAICDKTLKANRYSYTSKASVRREEFPLRIYDGLTLEQGFYDALIVELGSGEGDNWWCVVYPPLCFVGQGQAYQYKSKILDVINDFFCKEKK